MEFSMEWNVICRVCLQGGDMRSIYEKDDKDVAICEKIVKCSNITIKPESNLPQQICSKCLMDLDVAYKFKTNCESSDAILQSFIVGQTITDYIMSSDSGTIYKYRPPQGLNVKRIKTVAIKYEANAEDEQDEYTEESITDQNNMMVDMPIPVEISNQIEEQEGDDVDHFENDHDDDDDIDTDEIEHNQIKHEEIIMPIHQTELDPEPKDDEQDQYQVEEYEKSNDVLENQFDIAESAKICPIKPVKTNKTRSKANKKDKLRVAPATEANTKQDGTSVIKGRRAVEEPKPLKICEICGNSYKYKHALESHMRRHRNEKPFSCEICGRSFVINFELRRHMRTHTGQKPYPCRFCGRRFSDFGSRIKHERTHTGERPYHCETCGKSFAYSHVLSSHVLTHTGEKRFSCEVCGKKFAKSHHLKAHMNTHLKNLNKATTVKLSPTTATIVDNDSKTVLYQTEDGVYQEVLNVLTVQPKLENFGDDEDIKVIYTTGETQNAISTINLNT